ncbi:MAG TPA: PEP/pyruvate-binding domain-containing protein [Streptosporangiaceae bacterium]
MSAEAGGPRLVKLAEGATLAGDAARQTGAKAARLAQALAAGLPVLPGWVVPVAAGRSAMAAGAAAVTAGRPAAARRAVLGHRPDGQLAAELRTAVAALGGRVIARSSSPLEADTRWAGAFRSVAEVGPDDAPPAVASCWASAFAVDPLARLAACGLPADALEMAVLLQPEISPDAGGVARVAAGGEVTVEGVPGHPRALLAGWAESLPGDQLTSLIGRGLAGEVATLARQVRQLLGDGMIEWAAAGGRIWLLQSLPSGPPAVVTPPADGAAGHAGQRADELAADLLAAVTPAGLLRAREWMPVLAATVLGRGERVPARPAAPGTAAGRLLPCRPHERPAGDCGDAILLVDRPVPALAPLLFSARGIIARSGAAGSHLAGVARSLGVPMVVGCHPELITGPAAGGDGAWLAAIDGSTGEVALLPSADGTGQG